MIGKVKEFTKHAVNTNPHVSVLTHFHPSLFAHATALFTFCVVQDLCHTASLLFAFPPSHVYLHTRTAYCVCNTSPTSAAAAIIYFHHLSNFHWTTLKWVSERRVKPRDAHISTLQAWHIVQLHNGSGPFSHNCSSTGKLSITISEWNARNSQLLQWKRCLLYFLW